MIRDNGISRPDIISGSLPNDGALSNSLLPEQEKYYFDRDAYLDYYDTLSQSFKGTPYFEEYSNNPYVRSMRDLNPTFWDRLSENFGIKSNYSKNLEELALSSNTSVSELLQRKMQDKYNSAPESAQRDRQAGLNPDLVGLSNSPGASEMDYGASRPSGGVNTHDVGPMDILSGILQCVDFGLGVANQFVGMRGNILANDNAELSLNNVLQGITSGVLLPQTLMRDYQKGTTFKYNPKTRNVVMSSPVNENTLDSNGNPMVTAERSLTFNMPRKYGKRVASMMQNLYDSPDYQIQHNKSRSGANESKQILAKQGASDYFVGDYKLEDKLLKACRPLAKVADLQIKRQVEYFTRLNGTYQAEYENAQNRYHRDLFRAQNGTLEGEAHNAEHEYAKSMKDMRVKWMKALRAVTDNLYNMTLSSNPLERTAGYGSLTALAAVVMNPPQMSFNSSKGPGGKSKSFSFGL